MMIHNRNIKWNAKKEVDAAIFKPSLIDDYRDPPLKELPKIKRAANKMKSEFEEKCPESLSVKNVKSNTRMYDCMDALLITPQPRTIFDEVTVKEKSKIIKYFTPPLTERQQRRLLTPKKEWLLTELIEDGYFETEKIVRRLIEIEKEMRKAQVYFLDYKLLKRPTLEQNTNELEFIVKLLKFREYYKRNGETEKEFSLMIYMALHYEAKDDSWLWIVYELYLLALAPVKGHRGWDFGFCEAAIRYLFGRVLLERMNRQDEAYSQLVTSYDISLGKNWTTTCLTQIYDDQIHRNSAFLIYIIQLLRAEKWAVDDPDFAIDCLKDGAQKMIDTGTSKEMGEARLELAMMYNRAHYPEKAEGVLIGLIYHFSMSGISDWENLCNVHLYLAFVYRRMKLYRKALHHLLQMLEVAEKNKLIPKKAEALKHIGEFYLTKKMFHKARRYLKESKKLFNRIGYIEEVEEIAILHGYAKAVIHFPDYCVSLINGGTQNDYFFKLCFWAEYNTPFWRTNMPSASIDLADKSELAAEEEIVEEEQVEENQMDELQSDKSKVLDEEYPLLVEESRFTLGSTYSLTELFKRIGVSTVSSRSLLEGSIDEESEEKDESIDLDNIENLVTNKEDGLEVYLKVMKQILNLPGNLEEALDLGILLNCFLQHEHRIKILERIEEVICVTVLIEEPFATFPPSSRERRKSFQIVDSSSDGEDEFPKKEESSCKEACLHLKPLMETHDEKLPNKIYLIDLINQQRVVCNENYLLSSLPDKKPVFIPYSPGLVRLFNTFSSDEMSNLFILSPIKNIMSRISGDRVEMYEQFKPHSLLNESTYRIPKGRAGRIAKKEVTDLTPFKNIFIAKLDSIKNKVIEKHKILSGEKKRDTKHLN